MSAQRLAGLQKTFSGTRRDAVTLLHLLLPAAQAAGRTVRGDETCLGDHDTLFSAQNLGCGVCVSVERETELWYFVFISSLGVSPQWL